MKTSCLRIFPSPAIGVIFVASRENIDIVPEDSGLLLAL